MAAKTQEVLAAISLSAGAATQLLLAGWVHDHWAFGVMHVLAGDRAQRQAAETAAAASADDKQVAVPRCLDERRSGEPADGRYRDGDGWRSARASATFATDASAS